MVVSKQELLTKKKCRIHYYLDFEAMTNTGSGSDEPLRDPIRRQIIKLSA
jgi:hypothetical protein